MSVPTVIKSQFGAALDMLAQTIRACPDSIWYDEEGPNRFWHVAYHTLFYIHLYAQPTLADFVPWEGHRPDYERLGPPPWDPDEVLVVDQAYTQEEVMAYLAWCQEEVRRQLDRVDMDASSGFDWLPFTKLELQIYSIRHVQQHTGELSGRLLSAGIRIGWTPLQPT